MFLFVQRSPVDMLVPICFECVFLFVQRTPLDVLVPICSECAFLLLVEMRQSLFVLFREERVKSARKVAEKCFE